MPWRTTKSEGTKTIARHVEASMPLATATPSDFRADAPAPVARMSGSTPRMNVSEVMRTGRNREVAAVTAASIMVAPSAWLFLTISTTRMAYFSM